MNVTLSFLFPSAAASTKFTVLQVKGVPSGSTVVATCKGKGCPTKKVKGKKQNVVFTKKNASGTVNLTPFRNKALRAGAVLTVTVTKPGSFGMVKKLTVKKNKKPVLSTTCLQPNSTTAKASCVELSDRMRPERRTASAAARGCCYLRGGQWSPSSSASSWGSCWSLPPDSSWPAARGRAPRSQLRHPRSARGVRRLGHADRRRARCWASPSAPAARSPRTPPRS